MNAREILVGRRLRYLEAEPPASVRPRGTLVLVHAFPLNARMWEPQESLAAGGWRILAPAAARLRRRRDRPARGVDGRLRRRSRRPARCASRRRRRRRRPVDGRLRDARARPARAAVHPRPDPRGHAPAGRHARGPRGAPPDAPAARRRRRRGGGRRHAAEAPWTRRRGRRARRWRRRVRELVLSSSPDAIAGAIARDDDASRFDRAPAGHPLPDARRRGRGGCDHAASAQRGSAARASEARSSP